jgi:hypothetical protein
MVPENRDETGAIVGLIVAAAILLYLDWPVLMAFLNSLQAG